jgi:hypothetical protein
METKASQEKESVRFEPYFNAILAEYNMVRTQVTNHRQMQGQLDNLTLAALGVSITLILAVLDQNPKDIGVILSLPILFFTMAFAQLRHERQINLDAIYVDSELRPRASKALSPASSDNIPVFEYENYHARHYFPPNLLVQWIVTTSRAGIELGAGVGLIIACAYIQLAIFNYSWNAYQTWLLLVSLLILTADLTLGFYIARLHYNFYKQKKDSLAGQQDTPQVMESITGSEDAKQ